MRLVEPAGACWHLVLSLTCLLSCPSLLEGQEIPKARPKPTPRPTTPTVHRAPVERPSPQLPGVILVRVNAPCTVRIDGDVVATLAAGESKRVPVGLGKHLIEATGASDTSLRFEQVIELKSAGQEIVLVELVRRGQAPAPAGVNIPPAGDSRRSERDGLEYVFIPAGTFMMGCIPWDTSCGADENPRHEVRLTRGFWLGRTEVTMAAFGRFVTATGYRTAAERQGAGWKSWTASGFTQSPDHPVVNVTWDDAIAYCAWAGGRLPTEAEWEYAARAAAADEVFPVTGGLSHDKANYGKEPCPPCGGLASGADRWEFTAPVGSFPAGGYGLFDMAGNVYEWTSDWYEEKYYSSSPSTDPSGAASGQFRSLRGGSWVVNPSGLRASNRYRYQPAEPGDSFGLRCARDASP